MGKPHDGAAFHFRFFEIRRYTATLCNGGGKLNNSSQFKLKRIVSISWQSCRDELQRIVETGGFVLLVNRTGRNRR